MLHYSSIHQPSIHPPCPQVSTGDIVTAQGRDLSTCDVQQTKQEHIHTPQRANGGTGQGNGAGGWEDAL